MTTSSDRRVDTAGAAAPAAQDGKRADLPTPGGAGVDGRQQPDAPARADGSPHPVMHALAERVKELTALHETSRLLEDDSLDTRELLERIASLVPPAFQFPDVARACLTYGDISVSTAGFRRTPSMLVSTFETRDATRGALEVVYLEPRPLAAEGPFLAEERRLADSIAEILASTLERRRAEAALRASQQRLAQTLEQVSAERQRVQQLLSGSQAVSSELNLARLEANAQRDRVQLLLDITNAVVSQLDLDALLETICRLLTDTLSYHFASVSFWDEQALQLRRQAFRLPTSKGLLAKGALISRNSPADLAYHRDQTLVLRWQDIEALGEPSVGVMDAENLRSGCCILLKTRRAKYGVLSVAKPEDRAFSADEVQLLEQVAQQLAVAVENAITFQRAEGYRHDANAQRDRLRLLLDVNNALVSQLESDALRLSVLGVVRKVVDHDYAALVLYDPEANELRIQTNTFYDERGIFEPRRLLPFGRAPSALAFEERRVRTFDADALDRFDEESVRALREEGIRCLCCVPLITHRGVLGTLNVARRQTQGFLPSEVDLLGEVAGQVAIAVENTLAYQQISALKDRLAEEKLYLEDEITFRHDFTQIIGTSQALTDVLRQIRTVAPTDATVLLLGETGTGKELLARALHDSSRRREQTFVRVNGAALPSGLIESELFGYEKGAFTGAMTSKVGRLELAHRGTLFLDEVGDIPLEVQPKLLRVLQEKEFERLGSTRTQRVDLRLIAATNRKLDEMVAAEEFRSDLYYRLSVFPIHVPPLRERPEDIVPLVQHFVRRFSREMNRAVTTISTASLEALQRWTWPGNIRELQNVIERAVILSPGSELQVPLGALQASAAKPATTWTVAGVAVPESAYQAGEREMILKVLRETDGIVGGPDGAAARLGLKRTTLHSKMRKLGITRPSF